MSEKERIKSDMAPPQPSKHPDSRMNLKLGDLYWLSRHPKITYPLQLNGGKRSDDE